MSAPPSPLPPGPDPLAFLAGGGEMGAHTHAFAWAATPLGPPAAWPASLRTAVALVLRSRFPMLLWWGPEWHQFYNDAFRPSLGHHGKHPAALGQRGADCWPETWAGALPLLEQVRARGEATWQEDQLIPMHRDGRLQDVYWTYGYTPVLDEGGAVAGVLAICTETTRQVTALARARDSDQRFQNLVRDAAVGIVVLTGDEWRGRLVNDAYGRLIDRTPAQLLERPLFDVIPEAEEAFQPILDGVRRSGEPLHLPSHPYFVYADGKKIEGFLDLTYQPYREADGAITGVVVLCHDVSEQVRARQQVQELNEELAALNEEHAAINEELRATNEELNTANMRLTRSNADLDNFVYAASHDLKEPLDNLGGLLQALREQLPPTVQQQPDVAPLLAMMGDAVTRFQRTIGYLGDVVRLQQEFGQRPPRVELLPIIGDVRRDLQTQLAQAGARVSVDVAACPAVTFSAPHLRSVVYNLLSNALKYRHPGRIPEVQVRCRVAGAYTVLEVEDNGLGLTPAQQQELFALFRRFHGHVEGSGVGLYLVRRSVENAGGRIEVASTPGRGSTFSVFLPR